jgi:uncharacterized protein YecT (DUF1311 family)
MTIALAALALSTLSAQTTAPPDQCSNVSPQVERQCIGRRIERKQRRMETLYPRALAQVRRGYVRWGRNDNRMQPRFFEQAQRDWRRFVQSHCTATAAFGGGSNSSITDRFMDCYEQEIDRRIELFGRMADGSYGR